MAYFRCGSGGMPAGLQSGMDAVLNKKFGTSTTYPPSGWPSDVNLLGPLPVKTASGAIASFSDGADDVPVKSCVVTFTPSGGGGTPSSPVAITGYTGMTLTRTGKNLLALPSVDFTYKNVRYYTVNGVLYLDGTSTGETSPAVNDFKVLCFTLPAGTYYFDRGSLALPTYIYKKSDGTQLRVNSGSFTLTETTECNIGFYVYNQTFSDAKADVMLNSGSSGITYVDAVTPTSITDTFGQTIYGGERDLTTGKARVTYGIKTFDGTENWQAYTNQNGVFLVFSDMKSSLYGDGVCNIFTTAHSASDVTSLSMTFGVNNGVIYINRLFDGAISGVTDVASWKTWLTNNTCEVAYELATPTEITGLTSHEISTMLGDNNFYADIGNTAVEYRADIQLALNP